MAGELVVFADDDEQIRKLLQTYLSRRGYRVRLASDGAEALRAIAEEMPHLVITDVNMPLVNGFELTRRLREDHRTARLPILILSARKQAEDILAGYNEGADDYIAKPVEMAVLGAKVDALLRRAAVSVPVEQARGGRVIAFVHAKGGVGATALAVNTAIALTSTGTFRVGLLDLSLQFGNAGMLLDIDADRTLADLAQQQLDEMSDAVFDTHVVRHGTGLRVIAAPGRPEEAELVSVPVVQKVVDRFRRQVDYLVVDSPATLGEPVLAAVDTAELVCLVTAPHVIALRATAECLEVLVKIGVPRDRILLVLDRSRPRGLENDAVESALGMKPSAVIAYSDLFDDAADTGQPLFTTHPENAAAVAVRQLAALIARSAPLPESAPPR